MRIRTYVTENATWTTVRGLMLGHAPGPLPGEDEGPYADDLVRDDFSIEHGPVSLCHWDDPYASWLPVLAPVRAIARRRHWTAGLRARLKLDPAHPTECRPAYGWAEFVRIDLTVYVLLALLFAGGALFVATGKRR